MDASLGEAKSLTPTIYGQVGRLWRDRYGEHAGWAHTILFAADLTKFKKLRTEALGDADTKAASSPSKKRKSPSKKAIKVEDETEPAQDEEGAGAAVFSRTNGGTKKFKSPAVKKEDTAGSTELTPHSKKSKKLPAGAAELYEALYGTDNTGKDTATSPLFKPTPTRFNPKSAGKPRKLSMVNAGGESGAGVGTTGGVVAVDRGEAGETSGKKKGKSSPVPKIPRKRVPDS